MAISIANSVRFWAKWNPQGIMIRHHGQDTNWQDANARSSRLARGLGTLGVAPGGRVGILSNNCVQYCESVLGIIKQGAYVIPLNVRLVAEELEYIVDQSGCSVVFAAEDMVDKIVPSAKRHDITIVQLQGTPADGTVAYDTLLEASASDPCLDKGLDEPAFICYTSGTTGRPKGVVLTHQNVWTQSMHRVLSDNWCSEDRIYLPFPLAFTGGVISSWMPALFAGAMAVLDEAFDPERALQTMEKEKITILLAVPAVWAAMTQRPEFQDVDLSSLVHASSGGAPVPEPLINTLLAKGIPMAQGWGLTEGAGLSTTLPARDVLRKLGFAGLPLMHTRCKVVRKDGSDCDPGEVGELLLKGPDITPGYWKNEEATAEAIVDGWLHTGDLGLMDEEGYVKIAGRSKDMLISGGLNVYPAEIESVLASFPGIVENAVIGIEHEKWGETVLAIIIGDEELDKDAIVAHCKAELADYKVPRYIVFRDEELPKNMAGKVLKKDLREEYWTLASTADPVR